MLAATGEETPQEWRFTTSQPAYGWQEPRFDDGSWNQGKSVFGDLGGNTTPWTTSDIWLRRAFEATPTNLVNPHLRFRLELRILHDDDAEVYLNGEKVAALASWSGSRYVMVPLDDTTLLRNGRNTLAVHCHQDWGAQMIDVGLVEVIEPHR
jgi:beta-galactosidase